MSKALGGLAKSDKSGRARLGSAKTPKAQASAARSLAAAYAKAAAPLAKVDVNPADRAANAQLVGVAEGDRRRLPQGGLAPRRATTRPASAARAVP